MNDQMKAFIINMSGMLALIGLTAYIYLRTGEAIIVVIGGLILAVAALGAFMR